MIKRYWPAVPLAVFALFVLFSYAVAPPLADSEPTGEIVHSASFNDVRQTNAKYYDVERLPNGSALVAFEDQSVDCPESANVSPDCGLTGVRIIDPDSGEIQWRYEWLTYQQFSTEVHDADYLPETNEVVIADMEAERIFTVAVDTKAVTWQWHASSVYQEPAKGAKHTDWLHINDVDRIQPGVFMVSVRNADQILFVNRDCTCVVEVINPGSKNTLLNKQHNPQWLGGDPPTVLVSDSENDRAVQLERQGQNDWRPTWAIYEADGQHLDWPRDADRLPNGNVLITDTGNRRIVEVSPDGELIRSIRITGDKHVYEADVNGTEYPSGGPIENHRDVPGLRGQPFGVVSYTYNGLNYWVGLPYWINEWHVLFGAIALVLSAGTLYVRIIKWGLRHAG